MVERGWGERVVIYNITWYRRLVVIVIIIAYIHGCLVNQPANIVVVFVVVVSTLDVWIVVVVFR